jgi:hypothetical protein
MRNNPGVFAPEPRERACHRREHLKIIVSNDTVIFITGVIWLTLQHSCLKDYIRRTKRVTNRPKNEKESGRVSSRTKRTSASRKGTSQDYRVEGHAHPYDGGDVIDTSTLLVRGLYLLNCKRGVLPVPDRTTRKNQEGLRLKAKDRSYSSRQAERFECMRNSPNYLVALSYMLHPVVWRRGPYYFSCLVRQSQ